MFHCNVHSNFPLWEAFDWIFPFSTRLTFLCHKQTSSWLMVDFPIARNAFFGYLFLHSLVGCLAQLPNVISPFPWPLPRRAYKLWRYRTTGLMSTLQEKMLCDVIKGVFVSWKSTYQWGSIVLALVLQTTVATVVYGKRKSSGAKRWNIIDLTVYRHLVSRKQWQLHKLLKLPCPSSEHWLSVMVTFVCPFTVDKVSLGTARSAVARFPSVFYVTFLEHVAPYYLCPL